MIDDVTTERALSKDSYDSLAFKGKSAQYLAEVIDEVTQLSRSGAIYPPTFATSWSDSKLENGLSSQQLHPDDGRLSPAEAVAVRVLAEEGTALAQNLLKGSETTKLIQQITGDFNGWPSEIVGGMADFGYSLLGAVRVRESMVKGESKPTGTKLEDAVARTFWERFKNPLSLDGMTIKSNTVNAAVNMAEESVERKIQEDGQEDEKLLPQRIKSRRLGIELGARIYKQVLDIAIQRGLPTTLERMADAKAVELPQLPKVSK